MIHFRNFLFGAVCTIGGAILLVSGGIATNDPYTVSRHVESPAICQAMATPFRERFHFDAGCLVEIPAIKGDKLDVDR